MRLAHLYPEKKPANIEFASHHELHLREEEAMALTMELLGMDLSQKPILEKVFALLSNRNDQGPKRETLPSAVTYSYPSGRGTTMAEVKGANAEIAKGESVRWEMVAQTTGLTHHRGPNDQAQAAKPRGWWERS